MINNENNFLKRNIYNDVFSKEDITYLNRFYKFVHKLLIVESITFTIGFILCVLVLVTLFKGHVYEIDKVKYISFNWTSVYVFSALFFTSLLIQWVFNFFASRYVIFIIKKLKKSQNLTYFERSYWWLSIFCIWMADLCSIIFIFIWVRKRIQYYIQIIKEDSNI